MAIAAGNENRTVRIARVSAEQAGVLQREGGLTVDETYTHTADLYAVRHALKAHGDQVAEAARGQLAVGPSDVAAIPDILSAPDAMVFGARSKIGRELVGYVQVMEDGTTLHLEEVRTAAGSWE